MHSLSHIKNAIERSPLRIGSYEERSNGTEMGIFTFILSTYNTHRFADLTHLSIASACPKIDTRSGARYAVTLTGLLHLRLITQHFAPQLLNMDIRQDFEHGISRRLDSLNCPSLNSLAIVNKKDRRASAHAYYTELIKSLVRFPRLEEIAIIDLYFDRARNKPMIPYTGGLKTVTVYNSFSLIDILDIVRHFPLVTDLCLFSASIANIPTTSDLSHIINLRTSPNSNSL